VTHYKSGRKTSESEHENWFTSSDQGSASSKTYRKNLLQNDEHYHFYTYS